MAPQPEAALSLLVEAVSRAINHRLDVLHSYCLVLSNDMESAADRIALQRAQANLDDIRVGAYHRYSTELGRLQWFMKLVEPNAGMTAGDILREVEQALTANIVTLRKQHTRLYRAMGETLMSIGTDSDFNDLRTAAWYKASTEGRIYRWLAACLKSVAAGEPVAALDQDEED